MTLSVCYYSAASVTGAHDNLLHIISNVDRDERLSTLNLQSLCLRKNKISFLLQIPAINLGSRSSVIFSHLSGVCFAPSIHKPHHKANFFDCLIAQHHHSLCQAWGHLRERDGVAKIVEKMSPGEWNIDGQRGLASFSYPQGMDWEPHSRWATNRKAKTNTLICKTGGMQSNVGMPWSFPSSSSEVSLLLPLNKTIIRFTCTWVYFHPEPSRLNISSSSTK